MDTSLTWIMAIQIAIALGLFAFVVWLIFIISDKLIAVMADPNVFFLWKIVLFIPWLIFTCAAGAMYMAIGNNIRDWWHRH